MITLVVSMWNLAMAGSLGALPAIPEGVRASDGEIGEHLRQMLSPPLLPENTDHLEELGHGGGLDVTPGPNMLVYGYLAYWADNPEIIPWDDLSHVAAFAAEVDSAGDLSYTSRWNEVPSLVTTAHAYGVKIHLCVVNFNEESITTLLASNSARANLIANLRSWVDQTGADGVNIDFEGLNPESSADMVMFAQELHAEFGDEVAMATPPIDWYGAWDYATLSEYAYLFIMGYGYHWAGSTYAGPVDPLFNGDIWSYSLEWTVEDYLYVGTIPGKIVLGLPLYGYSWEVGAGTVPAEATANGYSKVWTVMHERAEQFGAQWDEHSHTPWYYGDGEQGWYQNADSIRDRILHAQDMEIGGVGFWALNYDNEDPELWGMIHELTMGEPEIVDVDTSVEDTASDTSIEDVVAYVADPGLPFLAYVGDIASLSGSASAGPVSELQFVWAQIGGPEALLDDPASERPNFEVTTAGIYVFELTVGDGTNWSAPMQNYVIGVDRPPEMAGCSGCSGAGILSYPWLGLAGLLFLRRR